jgi:hypothetical protein
MQPPHELVLLQSVVKEFARQRRIKVYDTVMALGFEVLEEPDNWDYHCTPVNSVTFGATGGDGVHFNLITGGPGIGAVVMTVPPGDIPNVVVGASFAEFLRLGYYGGFGWLEELAFNQSSAAALYRDDPGRLSKAGAALCERLRTVFGLVPIQDVVGHLERLREQYLSALVLPDPDEWNRRHGI